MARTRQKVRTDIMVTFIATFAGIVGQILALIGFISACLWLMTPNRYPARKRNRGGAALGFFGLAIAAFVLAGQVSGSVG